MVLTSNAVSTLTEPWSVGYSIRVCYAVIRIQIDIINVIFFKNYKLVYKKKKKNYTHYTDDYT